MSVQNVYFFFPDRRLGGGPFWLMRLAIELSKDPNYKVFYIDYKDGYSHKISEYKIAQKTITFIDFIDRDLNLILPEEGILFAPIYYMLNLPHINIKSKVLFHNWHNECLPCLITDLNFIHAQFVFFMSRVFANKAQIFLDGSHYYANNEISKMDFPPHFVPMTVNKKEIRAQKNIIRQDQINIAILGRLVQDKIYAVNNVIQCSQQYLASKDSKYKKSKTKIRIHIIGEGDCKNKIISSKAKNIEIIMCGTIENEKLHQYLANNVDLLFAMGTSVLEGAAIGLPSVVIPSEIKEFSCDHFFYVCDTKYYIVGFYPQQLEQFDLTTVKFASIIDDIYSKNKKQLIGKKCLDYVVNNHSVQYCTNLLKKYLNLTTLTFNDLLPYYEKTFVEYALRDHLQTNISPQTNDLIKNLVSNLNNIVKDLPNSDSFSVSSYRYVYDLGTRLFFNNKSTAKDYIISGMSYPEDSFTWTNDHVAIFRFIFKYPTPNGLLVQIDQIPYNGSQTVNVICNGNYVCQYIVDETNSVSKFYIDPSMIYGNEIKLKLVIPNAKVPSNDTNSKDNRILGLAIREILIDEKK